MEEFPLVPRAVRVLELAPDGGPIHPGLLTLEVGTRLVWSVRPNNKIDLVSSVLNRI